MQYNVAQLLREPTGSTRSWRLEEVSPGVSGIADRAQGEVQLLRTHQGIVVTATLHIQVTLPCSRCLAEFGRASTIAIEEEFFPSVDINTGKSLPLPDDAEGAFSIDPKHLLDLTDAIRQYVITHAPMKPLCRADCAGLCHRCGADLNQKRCACSPGRTDTRWAGLAQLLQE